MTNYPVVTISDLSITGSWQVVVHTQSASVDITVVRGVHTVIDSMTTTDPFGPAAARLTFPGLTALDALGENDLWWWSPGNDVDLIWTIDPGHDAERRSVVWEGYISGEGTSFSDAGGSMSMQLKGALRRVDNTLAMPLFPQQPIPFEHAIRRGLAIAKRKGARIGELVMRWPEWWDTRYTPGDDGKWWMLPMDVQPGDLWSGMLTRETGQNDAMLSSYVNGLLTSMHTDRGQFTLRCERGRIPVLEHRDRIGVAATMEVDLVTPGVTMEVSSDYESKANVIFGRGRGLDGVSFSNMQYTLGSGEVYYVPFDHHPSVHPSQSSNPMYDPRAIRREVSLTFYEGMDAYSAAEQARIYRSRFATAGHAGTITLTTDPYVAHDYGRRTMLRHTIVAGDVIRVRHFRGLDHGMLFNVTEANHSLVNGTTTLTVDTVFRDHLTTEEVRLRGRDALTTTKLLTVGSYSPSIRDQLLPWGPDSGYIPMASRLVFDDALSTTGEREHPFPWHEITMAHPPKDPAWEASYIHIPPAVEKLDDNWNTPRANEHTALIRLSQAGSISMLQIMAVDRDGVQMRVPFHVGFYYNESVSARDMPMLDKIGFTHPRFPGVDVGPYPFYPGAWESINDDGTTQNPSDHIKVPSAGSGLIAAYGSYDVPGGYYPGDPRLITAPTGLMQIENPFSYDVSSFDKDWIGWDPTGNSFATAGIVAVMIYCDSMWDTHDHRLVVRNKDVYFIGRVFRTPPGTG